MKRHTLWIVGIVILFGLAATGCSGSGTKEAAAEEEPAVIEAIAETGLNRVTLTEHAAQRLGIRTAALTEEIVTRELMVSGMVEQAQAADAQGLVRVRVPLTAGDMAKVAQGQPARIVAMDDDDEDDDDEELEADSIDADDIGDVEEDGDDDASSASTLYYQVKAAGHNLTPGQGVRVKLSVAGSGDRRLVVPYSALIYDLNGDTWIYVSPEPLVFTRHPVTVDYVEGDRAILSDGPPVGTIVATVGVPELYGADTGIGK